ncbi:MAG: hypothetical protein QNJ55_36825, partial [Xenococcus sp. MO_188.B8]|nr:hypothetical protein [Xenococcus sp. MO_188.B8]
CHKSSTLQKTVMIKSSVLNIFPFELELSSSQMEFFFSIPKISCTRRNYYICESFQRSTRPKPVGD